MNKFISPIFVLIALILATGCDTDNDYKTVRVDFCFDHPNYSVKPAEFETVTEEVLIQESHREGAVFETVEEQILVKQGYPIIEIISVNYIEVILDQEEQTYCGVPCITYLPLSEFIYSTVDPVFTTREYLKLVENGTGQIIPAKYSTRYYERLAYPPRLLEIPSDTAKCTRKNFVIPTNSDFNTYWDKQLESQGINGCGDETTYTVVE